MSEARTRETLAIEISALITRLANARDDAARDALLEKVLAFQRAHVEPYARIVAQSAQRNEPALLWPAVPTDVFRFVRVAVHPAEHDRLVFRTSGTTTTTTDAARGQHHVRDLALYDQSARATARQLLFPDVERMRLIVLAPSASELPDSSLSYMLDRFASWFGISESVQVWRDGALDLELLMRALREAEGSDQPVALLGTSFAFVHADDDLKDARFRLPERSRVMQTGGFKGRSREVAPDAMRQLLSARYGVPEAFIVAEYGMTELCSQLYEQTLRDAVLGVAASARRLIAPPWVRVSVVDPETLLPVADGREGLIRIDDLANLDTVCAIQTSDRGVRVDDGVVVLGRAAGAVARGCSLAVDAALARGGTRA